MLDPKIIRENPNKIRKMLKDRAVEFNLDSLIIGEKERREMIIKTDELRKKRNQVSLEIGKQKKAGNDASSFLEEMKKVSQELETLESTPAYRSGSSTPSIISSVCIAAKACSEVPIR